MLGGVVKKINIHNQYQCTYLPHSVDQCFALQHSGSEHASKTSGHPPDPCLSPGPSVRESVFLQQTFGVSTSDLQLLKAHSGRLRPFDPLLQYGAHSHRSPEIGLLVGLAPASFVANKKFFLHHHACKTLQASMAKDPAFRNYDAGESTTPLRCIQRALRLSQPVRAWSS